jgi:polar amino acid transport system permease protein
VNVPGAVGAKELTDKELQAVLRRPAAWKRRDVQRSLLIALVSTIVIFGIMTWYVPRTQGWEAVHRSFFSWPDFKAALPKVWDGFKLNIKIFMIAEPVVLALGLLLAVMRGSRNPVMFPLRAISIAYIDLFRGAPSLLVILMLGFGMPGLRIQGLSPDPVVWGTVACILTSSAYTAETFRAGIESIHPSQRAAARSLGLSDAATFIHVVLPQGVRRVIPPLISGFVALQKETALVSAIGPLDATRQAQIYAGTTFNYTSYLAAAMLFIALTIPLTRLTDYLLRRTARQRDMGGAV